ncbi:major facilitator superfamily domain-containing protein [Massariosphaeria phaeospora]|uniref:Major facilitator superfamily domain-containing protein n=1 Tax=Massariosphaeria phaeospora TaxID=100035 RepID=A0A7C8I219_9PLEO|nr:major facilitator superfamily domain-containing protein [Massariosphaeria phaeospora]
MTSNDATSDLAGETEIEQGLRARITHNPDTNAPETDADADADADEQAPLLSEASNGIRASLESDHGDEEPEWFGTAELRGIPWWKRPSIYWLLPPYFLFTLAFGGIIVPKLNLIVDLICDDYLADQNPGAISKPLDPAQQFDRCQLSAVSARSSLFILYGNLIGGILSAITSPKLGALSDRYGRKKLLIFTTSGVLVGEVLTILAAKYRDTVSVNWILVGYAADGLCGSFVVGMALAFSYAADCTPPHKRNVAFGYFHACLFLGIAVGPVLAGKVIEMRQQYVPKNEAVLLIFYIALLFHLVFISFLVFLVPESLSAKRQETAREKHRVEKDRLPPASDWINQLRSMNVFRPLKILWPTGPGTTAAVRRNLVLLAATDTIMFGVAMGAMGVVVIYTRYEFEWRELESGRFLSIVNSSRVLALLVLLPLLTRLVRGKPGAKKQRSSGSDAFDLALIRVAVLFDMLGFLGYSLARTGTAFTAAGAFAAIGGIGSPILSSALTKHVPPDRVGQLLGATGLLHAMARVVGPTIFNGIYSATVDSFTQTVFVCLTATFGLAFVVSWFVKPHVYLEDLQPDGSPSRAESTFEGGTGA